MNESSLDSGSILSFQCPRCGHKQVDDYEVIDLALPTDWRCAVCVRVFSVLLTECPHCASETLAVALMAREQPVADEVICHHCGKAGVCDEEAEGEEFVG